MYVAQIQIQTSFLFPLLSDQDRAILCRLYYLREWLDKAKDEKRFALSAQNLKQFKKKVHRKKSERTQLQQRLTKIGLENKLTEIQMKLLEDRYLALPAPHKLIRPYASSFGKQQWRHQGQLTFELLGLRMRVTKSKL